MCNQENKSNDILFWNLIYQSQRENEDLRMEKEYLTQLINEAMK